jgi:hypothetical protein
VLVGGAKPRLYLIRPLPHSASTSFGLYLIRGAEDSTGKWPVIVPAPFLFRSPLAVDFESKPEIQAGGFEFRVVRIEKTTTVRKGRATSNPRCLRGWCLRGGRRPDV